MDGQDTLTIHPRATGTSILRPICALRAGGMSRDLNHWARLVNEVGYLSMFASHNECWGQHWIHLASPWAGTIYSINQTWVKPLIAAHGLDGSCIHTHSPPAPPILPMPPMPPIPPIMGIWSRLPCPGQHYQTLPSPVMSGMLNWAVSLFLRF